MDERIPIQNKEQLEALKERVDKHDDILSEYAKAFPRVEIILENQQKFNERAEKKDEKISDTIVSLEKNVLMLTEITKSTKEDVAEVKNELGSLTERVGKNEEEGKISVIQSVKKQYLNRIGLFLGIGGTLVAVAIILSQIIGG